MNLSSSAARFDATSDVKASYEGTRNVTDFKRFAVPLLNPFTG